LKKRIFENDAMNATVMFQYMHDNGFNNEYNKILSLKTEKKK
jgi:hypothetical protein